MPLAGFSRYLPGSERTGLRILRVFGENSATAQPVGFEPNMRRGMATQIGLPLI
jgi:hypothetical protein